MTSSIKKRILIVEAVITTFLLVVVFVLVGMIHSITDVERAYFETYYNGYVMIEDQDTVDVNLGRSMQGDDNAYARLHDAYLIDTKQVRLLPYSIIVANRYHDKQACDDVYQILSSLYGTGTLDSLDAETRNIALNYLIMSQNDEQNLLVVK